MTEEEKQLPQSEQPKKLTPGQKRQETLKERYGENYMKKIARRGGKSRAEQRTSQEQADAGRKGGDETKRRHGINHYKKMGKKGGEAGKGIPKKKPKQP